MLAQPQDARSFGIDLCNTRSVVNKQTNPLQIPLEYKSSTNASAEPSPIVYGKLTRRIFAYTLSPGSADSEFHETKKN